MQMNELSSDTFKRRTAQPGEIIFLEGQPADNAFILLKGHAEVVIFGPKGELMPINRMGPGELFGELALLTSRKTRTATVTAADECELLEIKREVFEGRLAKADPLVRFILDHVSKRLVQLTDKIATENGGT